MPLQLLPVIPADLPRFKADMQEAFQKGAEEHGVSFCGDCPAFPCEHLPDMTPWKANPAEELANLRRKGDPAMILETERLILRKMNQDVFPALCRIMQDAQTMYAYEGPFTDEEMQAWLDRQLARYAQYGFGLWAVILKDTGDMIGQCGLAMQPWKDETVLEIGYLFERTHWRHGYAAEAAVACRKYAFEVLGAAEVCSIIRDTNTASQNVARRNGMVPADTWLKHYRGVNMPHIRFAVKRG